MGYKVLDTEHPLNATHCMDMLAGDDEREAIAEEVAGGERVWWMTQGWVQYRHDVFKGRDQARANENFPKHEGGAIVLDAVGHLEGLMADKPEKVLEYSDWMGIPLQPYPVALDRLKALLLEQVRKLDGMA